MKILKLPVDNTIHCICGCTFEFDLSDIITIPIYGVSYNYTERYVCCPYCGNQHFLSDRNYNIHNITWY